MLAAPEAFVHGRTDCRVAEAPNAPSYLVTAADLGWRLRVVVVVSNRDGRDDGWSAPTDVVAAAPPPPPPVAPPVPPAPVTPQPLVPPAQAVAAPVVVPAPSPVALRSAARGYASLAIAARRKDRPRFIAASATVRRSDAALTAALRRLRE